ncbi:aminopeptidase N [Roseobacter sp. HKCCA0434]|uniref:aminopeptidase N n=1 Tax=Roseobacter sp. HKCCA0434 TaxID=3079297 RepID=UPI0029059687|nr:aminopeptidase N [Roseobacter sp. HKCCA0434]
MTDVTRLADYAPFSHPVREVHLTFRLDPDATTVIAKVAFEGGSGDLRLDGLDMELVSATIDGTPVTPQVDATGLTVAATDLPEGPFTWEAETRIAPSKNTVLEGLYISNGIYCTQCEAEGFRRITFFPDRPDVMAIYTVRIEADLPVLLSNGNLTASGEGWAEWHDPWPKPSYLFALVAGDLESLDDSFTTRSGREVALRIWVQHKDLDRCAYAMESLKKAMAWDEREYGREYDLDLFQIVAVDDFNAGAMENKGLNVFNTRYVLASPETATDADFEGIESVIAHEYFHNWTGNRITCRDWFQLSLKEGLTVYRDQCFTADMRSAPVKRIGDVRILRAAQFREDAGPLAHPVRPESYVEINNFYTATVYEKGAELIRMLHAIIGQEGYDAALALYFDRHDGQACTIEDWLTCFEDATGRDLSHFLRWYEQAGTPTLTARHEHRDGQMHLTFAQSTPPTPGQPDKQPVPIPIRWGLLTEAGEVASGTFTLTEAEDTLSIPAPEGAVPSLLRDFSAPVILKQPAGGDAFRLAHDTDPFNRAEAGRALALATLVDGEDAEPWLDGMVRTVTDDTLDAAFRAQMLALPGEAELARAIAASGRTPDPDAIHTERRALRQALAEKLADRLADLEEAIRPAGPYSPDGDAPGGRALANALLGLWVLNDGPAAARAAFDDATNLTDSLAALGLLVSEGAAKDALASFHARWHDTPLVLDKWFGVQAVATPPGDALDTVRRLAEHPDFTWRTPNRFRALIPAFAANHAAFHRADGAGYRLVADWLMRMDPVNPSVAARSSAVFETWRRYDSARQALIEEQLERLASRDGLSRDMAEMVGRMRAG